jgi:hypothetical protein
MHLEPFLNAPVPGPKAGNTCETLAPVRINAASATPLATNSDAAAELTVFHTQQIELPALPARDGFVSREEFDELLDAFVRLIGRIESYNLGAPYKI